MVRKAAVIMGSDSDWPVVQKAVSKLKSFGVETEVHVMSAHRTPMEACEFAKNAAANGFGVIIAAAGMAAHTVLPVIGLPLKSAALDGMDALLSTVQMPPGVPVATVGIDAAANAGTLAVQILALGDEELTRRLTESKKEMAETVREKDRKMQELAAAL